MEYIHLSRELGDVIKASTQQSPIITILGPLGAGKSDFVKSNFKNHVYLDMQYPVTRNLVNSDPNGFLQLYNDCPGIIIDEAQHAVSLFPHIKIDTEKDPRPHKYVLVGSQNFLLNTQPHTLFSNQTISYMLFPLSVGELFTNNRYCESAEAQAFKGFYPQIYKLSIFDVRNYYNYLLISLEREFMSLGVTDVHAFKKFMYACAVRIGTPLDFNDLSSVCDIGLETAKQWLAVLENCFILFLLPPYHNDFGRCTVRSPKIYFYDCGLATSIMNLEPGVLFRDKSVFEPLFENLIIADYIKYLASKHISYKAFFFQVSKQHNIKLVIEIGEKIFAVDTEPSELCDNSSFDSLLWFEKLIPNVKEKMLFYKGFVVEKTSNNKLVNWKHVRTTSF